jgi:hypothetical protein
MPRIRTIKPEITQSESMGRVSRDARLRISGILQDHPKLDGPILVEAWKRYVAKSPEKLKAPQYYFGKKEDQDSDKAANWLNETLMLFRIRTKAQAEAKALPPPPEPPPAPEEPEPASLEPTA